MDFPRRIGRYEIVGRLATGGMAEIFLGRLTGPSGFERPVVVKRMLPHLARRPGFGAMFIDEARITARMQHPNVVQVFELGEDGGDYFLAMEYVNGETADALVRRLLYEGRRLPYALATHVVAEACSGLHAAHELRDDDGNELGVVHRDVSPDNLLVTYFGSVKVADFGIAKGAHRQAAATETGALKGKLPYMSPEQCRGQALDRRTDIFSLGAVLYELTTNRRLFKRPTAPQVISAICSEPILPPSRLVPGYPRALEEVCMRALARSPSDRYPTAAAFRLALVNAMRSLDEPADPAAEIANLMRELFHDRIAEKNDMLRQVREGTASVRVPEEQIETLVDDVPSVIELPVETPASNGGRARARTALWASAVSLVVALVAAGVLMTRRPAAAPDAASPTPAASAALVDTASAPVEEPLPASSADATPADAGLERVVLHVETSPPGAVVRVQGRRVGRTPCDVHLAKSSRKVRVEIYRAGFSTVVQELVPDVDQRLVVPLRGLPRSGRGAASTSRPPARPPTAEIPVFPD